MNHLTLPRFWRHYQALPEVIREVADKNFDLLRNDPHHPSLHFKKVGKAKHLWSVRVGLHHRALGMDQTDAVVWFWIGPHAEYDQLLS